MKYLIFSFLLLGIGCGRYEFSDSQTLVGKQLTVASVPTLNVFDTQDIQAVCNALSKKSDMLTEASVAAARLKFSVTARDCKKTEKSHLPEVRIDLSTETFKTESSGGFPFSDIETLGKGILKGKCDSIQSIYAEGKKVTIIRSADRGQTACPAAAGEVCLRVLQGVSEGQSIHIRSEELIRFKTDVRKGLVGFFSYRELLVKDVTCEEGEYSSLKAELLQN